VLIFPVLFLAMIEDDEAVSSGSSIVRNIPAIEHSISSTDPLDYLTVTERYYTNLYRLDTDRERQHDVLVLNHSNKICLITLAPSHPVLANKLEIKKVNFEVSKKVDRKTNKTSGKSKKGGQILEPTSVLAIVETEAGNFPVPAVVPGKLICINQEIITDPSKLSTHPDSEGHIAIILPSRGLYEQAKQSLLSKEQYIAAR